MRIKNLPGVTTRDSFNVPPALLHIQEGYNIGGRAFDAANEDDSLLMAQIRATGVTEPLKIEAVGNVLYVRSGHRRHGACMALLAIGHDVGTVPCVAIGRGMSELDKVYDLALSNNGKRVEGMALADVFAKASALQESPEAIAARLGYSIVHVKVMLALTAAPQEIQDMVRAGVVGATFAGETLRAAASPADAVATLQAAIAYEESQGAGGPLRVTAKTVRKARTVGVSAHRRAAAGGGDGDTLDAGQYYAKLRTIFDASGNECATCVNQAMAKQLVSLLNRS